MSFGLVLSLAWRKIRFHKVRSIIMALPIIFMVAIIVALIGWVGGFKNFIDKEVIEPVEQQQYLLSVERPGVQQTNQPSFALPFRSIDLQDIAKLKSVPGVGSVTPNGWNNYSALVNLESIHLTHAVLTPRVLDNSLAGFYGATDFTFQPGQPIPVIIGAQALQEMTVDLGGKDSVTASTICNSPDGNDCQGPVKQIDHRELLSQQLVGKTGTLSYIFVPQPPQVISTYKGSTVTYTQASAAQQAAYEQKIQQIFGPYWDLSKLQNPEQFSFKIVGINKDSETPSSFMPANAIIYIANRLHQREAAARTTAAIPGNALTTDLHPGIINDDNDVQINPMGLTLSLAKESFDKPYWSIPGLVAKPVAGKNGKLTLEEVPAYHFTTDSLLNRDYIVQIADPSQRKVVQKAISELGLGGAPNGVDESGYMMSTILKMLAIAIGIISAIATVVVFVLCWGFVADANYEIGLLRAMGARIGRVRQIMMTQIVYILLCGAVVGMIFGGLLMYYGAPWAASYINTSEMFKQMPFLYRLIIKPEALLAPDFGLLALCLAAVLLLPLLATVLATLRRLHIHPLEALKKDF